MKLDFFEFWVQTRKKSTQNSLKKSINFELHDFESSYAIAYTAITMHVAIKGHVEFVRSFHVLKNVHLDFLVELALWSGKRGLELATHDRKKA